MPEQGEALHSAHDVVAEAFCEDLGYPVAGRAPSARWPYVLAARLGQSPACPFHSARLIHALPGLIRLSPDSRDEPARPAGGEAFLAFDKAVGRGDGAIPPKYRELIALAVSLTTQCAYCLDVHTGRALEAGATREGLAEVAFIAASLRAGAALGHGMMMLRLAEQGGRANPTAPE